MRLGKQLMEQQGMTVSADEVQRVAQQLAAEKTVKGRKRLKTDAELTSEARKKLIRQKAVRLVPSCSLYTLRHTWATSALQRGVDPLTVAILMGHRDPSMLARVYQHLSLNPQHLLEQAQKAAG